VVHFVAQVMHFASQLPPFLQQSPQPLSLLLDRLEQPRVADAHRSVRRQRVKTRRIRRRRRARGGETRRVEAENTDGIVVIEERREKCGVESRMVYPRWIGPASLGENVVDEQRVPAAETSADDARITRDAELAEANSRVAVAPLAHQRASRSLE